MKIIGIDPSFRHTGVALLTPSEIKFWQFDTNKDDHDFVSATLLTKGLGNLIDQLWSPGTEIAFEMPVGSQSARASKASGVVLGVLASVLDDYNYHYFSANAIKKFVGEPHIKGANRKKLNINAAFDLYPNAPWDKCSRGLPKRKEEHKADALLLAHLLAVKLASD